MKRTILGFALFSVPTIIAACSAGNDPVAEATSHAASPELAAVSAASEEARRLVQTLQSRLGIERPSEAVANGATVTLAARASGAFRVRDARSNATIDVGLVGATDALREDLDGFAVYRSGHLSGAHLLQRTSANGTEDYLVFEKNLPNEPVVRYQVALGDGIAGLRLVSHTLEFLDKTGTPRLRMAPPYAVDGDGARIALHVSVEDCAVDTSPIAPWGRTPIAPGKERCIVRLQFESPGEGSRKAPLIVDPAWIATGDLATPRTATAAALLPNGKVLVAGGDAGPMVGEVASAEIYDPKTDTWTTTQSLKYPRSLHTATTMKIDTTVGVFVAGGKIGPFPNSTFPPLTEFYDPATGTWSDKGILGVPRAEHTATRIDGGRVALIGGYNAGGAVGKYEIFDGGYPAAAFSGKLRRHHTATLTSLGKVLVVGGEGFDPMSAELWDPVQWPSGPPTFFQIPTARVGHAAVALPAGRVLVVGGFPSAGMPQGPNPEIWTPGANTWMPAGSINPRAQLTLSPLSLTRFIAVGGMVGDNPPTPHVDADIFDAAAGQWSQAPSLLVPRFGHEAVAMPGGRVLVIGGQPLPLQAGPNAEIFACEGNDDCGAGEYCDAESACVPQKGLGEACNPAADCKNAENCDKIACHSGFCADGVCCDAACSGQCEACNGAVPGQCSVVTGDPVTNEATEFLPKRSVCAGNGTVCGGSCGGTNANACESFPSGIQCNVSCDVDTLNTYTCDGMGKCATIVATSCGAYLCNDTKNSCQTTCMDMGVNQCGDAYTCNTEGACVARPTKCDPDNENQMFSETNETVSCGNYVCRGSACLTACVDAYDCFGTDMVCTEGGVCTPFITIKNEPSSGSCGCSVPGDDRPARGQWALALAAAFAIANRKRQSRSAS